MTAKSDSKTILVVEDEPDLHNFASRVLELEGYRVLQAEDGASAVKHLNENKVGIVLLDLQMPGVDGWSIIKKIKASPATAQIQVIVFTASANVERKAKAIELGAAEYLIKPLSADELRKAVARVLKQKGTG